MPRQQPLRAAGRPSGPSPRRYMGTAMYSPRLVLGHRGLRHRLDGHRRPRGSTPTSSGGSRCATRAARQLVRTILGTASPSRAAVSALWDLRDDAGTPVRPGRLHAVARGLRCRRVDTHLERARSPSTRRARCRRRWPPPARRVAPASSPSTRSGCYDTTRRRRPAARPGSAAGPSGARRRPGARDRCRRRSPERLGRLRHRATPVTRLGDRLEEAVRRQRSTCLPAAGRPRWPSPRSAATAW